MGACYSQRKIQKELKKDFRKQTRIAKLLLLGAGQSGKSTIVKQIKLIQSDRDDRQFTEEEKYNAKIAVYFNMVDSLLTLIAAVSFLNIEESENESNSNSNSLSSHGNIIFSYGNYILEVLKTQQSKIIHSSMLRPTEEVINTFREVWSNPCIKAAYSRRNEFQLMDSTEYYMSEMDRICEKDYEPNNQDVLRTRIQTKGVASLKFHFQNGKQRIPFEIYDVGGQKGQRKNWIKCFDNVTCVLFVVSIAEYDQVLEEEQTTNRMQDSIQLFGEIVNGKYFLHTPFIIFFNKFDIFLEKIPRRGIKNNFPDYEGPTDCPKKSLEFLKQKYLNQIEIGNNKRSIYTHTTTATDTDLIENVFKDVMNAVLKIVFGNINIE